MTGCTIQNNTVFDGGRTYMGTVRHCRIWNNTAPNGFNAYMTTDLPDFN
ncbi:MAG: hypothetical protein LBB45_00350 [Methanobrevibacter sp.]|nr:hypothetical protein [Candidatus Methanovirga basalitermitum]